MLWTNKNSAWLQLAAVVTLGLLAGCRTPATDSTPTTVLQVTTAVQTPSSTPTRTPIPATPTLPVRLDTSLQPTATPFIHTIVADDTLLGIALAYGVQVEEILAANPGINPQLLSIGMTLTIPLAEDGSAALPTAEPLPVALGELVCYRTLDAGAWCFVLARNDLDQPVESLTARLALLDSSGQVIATQQAAPPLNLIPPGESLPVYGFFEGPLPEVVHPRVELISAFPATDTRERYIPLAEVTQQISLAEDGLSATIQGQLQVAEGSSPASRIRLAAIGYDAAGQVVGVRVWEHPGPLGANEMLDYDFRLFSLGPRLERVVVFSEGRP